MNVPQVQDSRDEASHVPTLWGRSSTGSVLADEDLLPDQFKGFKHLEVTPETEGLFISLVCELKFKLFDTCVYSGFFLQVGEASGTNINWQPSAVRHLTAS